MSDVWAHCPGCDRWFYPGAADFALDGPDGLAPGQPPAPHQVVAAGGEDVFDSRSGEADPRCPVCWQRPDRMEDREPGAAEAAASADVDAGESARPAAV